MKRISATVLGAFLYFAFASSASAALVFCVPPPYNSTATAQQQYADCQKSKQETSVVQSAAVAQSEVSAQTQQPSGLTESQIQAIVMLLQAFGADQAIVTQVETALRGTTTTAH